MATPVRKSKTRAFTVKLKNAVRQALAAVQVDPIRSSEPLNLSYDEDAEMALEILRAPISGNPTWAGMMPLTVCGGYWPLVRVIATYQRQILPYPTAPVIVLIL